MTRTRRLAGVLAALLLGVALLSGCGGGDSEGDNPGESVLRVAFRTADPSSLDPIKSTAATDNPILWTMYDNLIDFDPETLSPVPGLAESWEFEDALTLRLDLVKGVTFQDGTPLDADAVKFNLDRARDPEGGGNLASQLAIIESVEVRDSSTVVLHLKGPAASLLLTLADRSGMIASPTAIKADPERLAREAVGTGPYTLDSWTSSSELRVKKNPDYWKSGEPSLAGITFRMMPDPTARVNALRSGDVDFIYSFDPSELAVLDTDSDLVTYSGPSIEYNALYTNMSQEPLDNVKVRQAISMAIDRDALAKAVTGGVGNGAWLPTSEASWAYAKDLAGMPAYDPDQAKALLAEAGYPNGTSFKMVIPAEQGNDRRAEIVQAQLKEIGIDVEVQTADYNQAIQQYLEGRDQGLIAPSTSGPDPAAVFRVQFTPDGLTNAGRFEDKELLSLIAEGEASEDLTVRAETYEKLQRRVLDLAFNIPLNVQPNAVAYSKRVMGFVPNIWAKPEFTGVSMTSR